MRDLYLENKSDLLISKLFAKSLLLLHSAKPLPKVIHGSFEDEDVKIDFEEANKIG